MTDKKKRGNVEIDGSIDAGFTSYGVPKQTTADENGNMETKAWPDHIDKDSLTDKQRKTLELAFQNPTMTASAIDEEIGSKQYANSILRDKVPEWYENVFKNKGESAKSGYSRDTIEVDTSTPETTETSETDVQAVIDAMKATAQFDETISALEVVEDHL